MPFTNNPILHFYRHFQQRRIRKVTCGKSAPELKEVGIEHYFCTLQLFNNYSSSIIYHSSSINTAVQ